MKRLFVLVITVATLMTVAAGIAFAAPAEKRDVCHYKPKQRWVLKACFHCGELFEDREKFFNRRGGGLSRTCRECNRRWRDWF
jgi:hypothetical protein